MSDELLSRVLSEVIGLRGEWGEMRARIGAIEAKLGAVEAKVGAIEAEQRRQAAEIEALRRDVTRLRTDLSAQVERVLNEQSGLRDDMTVVMARLDRVDATSHNAVTELRALHRQFTRLAARVTALEDPKSDD